MNKSTKERILEWYLKGFKDALQSNSFAQSSNVDENVAYRLGVEDAILGDDNLNFDYKCNPQLKKLLDEYE